MTRYAVIGSDGLVYINGVVSLDAVASGTTNPKGSQSTRAAQPTPSASAASSSSSSQQLSATPSHKQRVENFQSSVSPRNRVAAVAARQQSTSASTAVNNRTPSAASSTPSQASLRPVSSSSSASLTTDQQIALALSKTPTGGRKFNAPTPTGASNRTFGSNNPSAPNKATSPPPPQTTAMNPQQQAAAQRQQQQVMASSNQQRMPSSSPSVAAGIGKFSAPNGNNGTNSGSRGKQATSPIRNAVIPRPEESASAKKAAKPAGMVYEDQPYAVKALYSHVGSIPEQLSFKRGEFLEIDAHMEGWLSATVIDTERRGWIPSNYVERVPEGSIQLSGRKNKVKSSNGAQSPSIEKSTSPSLQQQQQSQQQQKSNTTTTAAKVTPAPAATANNNRPAATTSTSTTTAPSKTFTAPSSKPSNGTGPSSAASSPSATISSDPFAHLMTDNFTTPPRVTVGSFSEQNHEPLATPGPQLGHMPLTHQAPNDASSLLATTAAPVLLEALYDFAAEYPDQQLSFQKGDVFVLVSQHDKDWWDCKRPTGEVGAVPALYVRELKNVKQDVRKEIIAEAIEHTSPLGTGTRPSKSPSPAPTLTATAATAASPQSSSNSVLAVATHRSLYPFTGTVAGQLSYGFGEYLTLINKEHEGWWSFRHLLSGKEGLVAQNYVIELTPEEKKLPMKTPEQFAVIDAAAATKAAEQKEDEEKKLKAKQDADAKVAREKVEADAKASELTRQKREADEKAAAEVAQKKAAEEAIQRAAAEAQAAAAAEKQRQEAEVAAQAAARLAAEHAATKAAAEALAAQKATEAEAQRQHEESERRAAELKLKADEAEALAKKQREDEEAARIAAEEAAAKVADNNAASASTSTSSSYPRHPALFPFTATQPGQVSLDKGEIVEVHDDSSVQGWWCVKTSNGDIGMSPANYFGPAIVEEASATVSKKPPPVPQHLAEHMKRHSTALSTSEVAALTTNSTSHTPSGSVDITPAAASAPSVTTLIALYPFTGTVSGQLSFAKDEHLTVITPARHGWILVKNASGEEGNVPENYVKKTVETPVADNKSTLNPSLLTPLKINTATPSASPQASTNNTPVPSSATKLAPPPVTAAAAATPPTSARGTAAPESIVPSVSPAPSSSVSGAPPPVPQHLAEHMKRHSTALSTSDVASNILLTASKPVPTRAGGPPPLSNEMAEHVKRMSMSMTPSAVASINSAAPSPAIPSRDATPLHSRTSSDIVPAGSTHRAMYSFTASAQGQLSYAKGDYLTLISEDHPGWWRFSHHASGLQGLIASNYVKSLSELSDTHGSVASATSAASSSTSAAAPSSSSSTSYPRHRVLFNFTGTVAGQVSLKQGEIVEIHEPAVHVPGWSTVKTSTGLVGMAPTNYLDMSAPVNDAAAVPGRASTVVSVASTVASTSAAPFAEYEVVCLYSYAAQSADQLTFTVGDRLFVVALSAHADWVSCRDNNGRIGLAPLAYLSRVICRVRTLYDLQGDTDKNLLGFQVDEIIRVIAKEDLWATGWKEQQQQTATSVAGTTAATGGLFPLSYVEDI